MYNVIHYISHIANVIHHISHIANVIHHISHIALRNMYMEFVLKAVSFLLQMAVEGGLVMSISLRIVDTSVKVTAW